MRDISVAHWTIIKRTDYKAGRLSLSIEKNKRISTMRDKKALKAKQTATVYLFKTGRRELIRKGR